MDEGGCVQIRFYTIKNGRIVVTKAFDYSGKYVPADKKYWRINGKNVSESEYNKELSGIKEKNNKKFGKAKTIKTKDYTRYHYYNRKSLRFDTETGNVKTIIKGNKLILKGFIYDIPGEKHIFKLTS